MKNKNLQCYKIKKEKFNEIIDFEAYKDIDSFATLIIIENSLVDIISGEDFYLDDIDLDEMESHQLSIRISYKEYFGYYKNYLINQNIDLFEEVLMHEDDINRNLKKLEFIEKMISILK